MGLSHPKILVKHHQLPRHKPFEVDRWDNALERVVTTVIMEEGLLADVNGEFIPELIPENEDLVHVLDVLCTTGYGAWIVGGAVRDCILGKIPEEFDICTTATPEQVCESFEDTIPTGIDYGTITVKVVIHYLRSQHCVQKLVMETAEGPILSSLALV